MVDCVSVLIQCLFLPELSYYANLDFWIFLQYCQNTVCFFNVRKGSVSLPTHRNLCTVYAYYFAYDDNFLKIFFTFIWSSTETAMATLSESITWDILSILLKIMSYFLCWDYDMKNEFISIVMCSLQPSLPWNGLLNNESIYALGMGGYVDRFIARYWVQWSLVYWSWNWKLIENWRCMKNWHQYWNDWDFIMHVDWSSVSYMPY